MKKALELVKASYPEYSKIDLEIKPTHLYVKFKPEDEKQYGTLKLDSILDYYTYPLDYELTEAQKEEFIKMRTSSNAEEKSHETQEAFQKTPLYCSVPVGYTYPEGVGYDVLEALFIPDENKDIHKGETFQNLPEEFIDALVLEALKLTNNLDENEKGGRVTHSSWRPAGRVTLEDDFANTRRGVEGVIVRARRWCTTHRGMTNEAGNYSCDGTFKRPANYSIDWERFDFALREGWLDGANINGPKQRGDWNQDLSGTGRSAFHAKVFMAAYHYYYKDIKGLRRPPQNSFWRTQMRIRCYQENNNDNGNCNPARRFLGLGSTIKIFNPNRPINEIYGTTIHELAHASHWNMDKGNYNCMNDEYCWIVCCSGDLKVAESWARGVQWDLGRMVWNNYRGGPTNMPNYTQVVVDMIDDLNDTNNGSNDINQDNVNGYSIRQIEDALQGQKSWNGWRDNIKNRYTNATENNVDALFAHWN